MSVATDNMTAEYNEAAAPRLAAFDQAVDLEDDTAVQTTIAHSAGAPMAGTAERSDHGMTTDKFLYLAPAGTGHGVDSPQDTANPDADRAVIQTREDRIWMSQAFGGGFHADGFWGGGDPSVLMDAPRLESGYAADSTGESPKRVGDGEFGGHSGLWHPDSTSRDNIQAFIYGGDLVPEIPGQAEVYSDGAVMTRDGLDLHPEITTPDGFDEFRKPYSEVFP